MAWNTPASPILTWKFGDANTYLRDNWTSIRRYFTAPKFFTATVNLTTTDTKVLDSGGLCSDVPDEGTKMIVCCVLDDLGSHTGGVAKHRASIKNQGGTLIGNSTPRLVAFPQTMVLAYGTVAAGTNPGFQVFSKCDAGTMQAIVSVWAMVGPQ